MKLLSCVFLLTVLMLPAHDADARPMPPYMRNAMNAPAVGEAAPDFELARLNSSATVRLSDYAGKRPVVLVFGSYT